MNGRITWSTREELRDQIIRSHIRNYLRAKGLKGEAANSMQIATAVSVRRDIVALKLINMQAAKEIVFVGHKPTPGCHDMAYYTMPGMLQ